MNRIYLVHDWFGPQGPMTNNQAYSGDLSRLKFDKYGNDFFKMIGGYEPIPSYKLNDWDYFIYPMLLSHESQGWVMQPTIDLLSSCSISPQILKKIRDGRGWFLMNLCDESIFNDSLFDRFHDFATRENIKLNKIIFQIGSKDAKDRYNDYCLRKGISQLNEKGTKNVMHISCIEYFEFKTSFQMNNNYDDIEINRHKNVDFNNIKKTFLCMNRHQRYSRVNLLLLFYKLDLLKNSYYSMPSECINTKTLWKDSVWIDENLINYYNITNKDIDDIQELLPLELDKKGLELYDVNLLTNLYDADTNYYYDTSLISVITETNYQFEKSIFNTEKIWRPIANRHPFIMIGPTGTLKYLKELGYRTFDDFWDESYDTIIDPAERLKAITELCYTIDNWSDHEKLNFFYKSMVTTDHNYRWLKSINDKFGRRTFFHDFRDIIFFSK
jgi:hypothetical protein